MAPKSVRLVRKVGRPVIKNPVGRPAKKNPVGRPAKKNPVGRPAFFLNFFEIVFSSQLE
jgi:hypothetical protein